MFSFTQRRHRSTWLRIKLPTSFGLLTFHVCFYDTGETSQVDVLSPFLRSVALRSGTGWSIFEFQRWSKCLAHSRCLKKMYWDEVHSIQEYSAWLHHAIGYELWTVSFSVWNLTPYVVNSRDKVYFLALIYCDIICSCLSGNKYFKIALKWSYREEYYLM